MSRRKKWNEDGSTFVEAAVVLPVTILAVIAAILIISFISHWAFDQVNIHGYLRKKDGIISGTRLTDKEYEDFKWHESFSEGRKIITSDTYTQTQGGGLLNETLKKKIEARVYEINEKEIIMYSDFFKKTWE